MKAVRAVLEYFKSGGVSKVFGIPAGSVNAFFDELVDIREITPIIAKHEGAAGYMAAAYSKYGKQLSVCIGSSGPGSTNLLSGAANAMREHLPILFLTGAVPVGTVGLNASQELDAEPLFRSVTKYSVTVKRSSDLLREVARAVEIALSDVPGPVHVAMPIDVQLDDIAISSLPSFPLRNPLVPETSTIERVANVLVQKESGIIFVGQGARGSVDKVMELAEMLDWPIVATPQAKGLIRDDHPLFSGVFGFAGHEEASKLIHDGFGEAIVIIGSSLGETATNNYNDHLTKSRFVVQFDFDHTVFGRKYKVDEPVLGDIDLSLLFLNEELRTRGKSRTSKQHVERAVDVSSDAVFNTKNVLLTLQRLLPKETRYTVDIGEFMSYVIHDMHVFDSNTFDINVHFGAMGSGIGSALGSLLAEPDRPVASITGDGCFFMHGMELLTAKEYGLPILFVVINNARLGMVYHGHMLQYKRSHPRFEQTPVDLFRMASALDIPSVRIEKMTDLTEASLQPLLSASGPAIVDIALIDNNAPPMGDRVKFLSSFGK